MNGVRPNTPLADCSPKKGDPYPVDVPSPLLPSMLLPPGFALDVCQGPLTPARLISSTVQTLFRLVLSQVRTE